MIQSGINLKAFGNKLRNDETWQQNRILIFYTACGRSLTIYTQMRDEIIFYQSMDACRYPTIRRATLANDIDCLRHCTVEMSLAQNISYVCIYVYIYFIVDNCVRGAQPRPDAIGPSRRGPAVIKSCTDYRIKAFVKNTVNIHRIKLCKIRIQIRSTRAERFVRRIDRCEVPDYNLPFQRPRINESRFTLETNRNADGDYFNSERSDSSTIHGISKGLT